MKERDEATISYTMSRIKGKDTSIEIKLRKELTKLGYRYNKNCSDVFGHPDVVFKKYKVAIFCDSEFWHGYNFEENKKRLHKHIDYWIPKIERNIERDKEVNEKLRNEGYSVLRFWGNEINKELPSCIAKIEEVLKENGYKKKVSE